MIEGDTRMREGACLTLSDGREVRLQDDSDILLSICSNHEETYSLPFSCPPGGYGGGTLLLSPSEQYLIFSFFSGESEEGFSLFRIEDSRLVPPAGINFMSTRPKIGTGK